MQLIFFRHGIAEDLKPDTTDAERHLTVRGIHRLRDELPGFKRLLDRSAPLAVWSSPLCRALETAQILADEIGSVKVRTVPAILDGDLGELLRFAAYLEPSTQLIVVGHEPTLGLWSQALTGITLPFKKAAAAAIEWMDSQVPHGQLVWFCQPRTLRRLK
ncbi:MAG: histidine phosphatase family protein [Clostridiaceae bacterium]|jgi:phosphohistidine phosphatase|nr:histidine phosphatase family protein [Clostridiaceae bacterium]